MLSLFYINYQFLEENYLKRRYNFNIIMQIVFKFALILSHFLNFGNEVKFTLGIILGKINNILNFLLLGLLVAYDYFIYTPYFNKYICIFYGTFSLIFLYTIALLLILEYTSYLMASNFFCIWALGFPLLYSLIYTH